MNKEKQIKLRRILTKKDKTFVLSDSVSHSTVPRKTNYLLNNAFSLFIYLSTFLIFYYLKKQTLILTDNYDQLLGFLAFSLIVGSVLSNKFILTIQHELWQIFRKLCISLILSLGFLSILLLNFQVSNISRGFLISVMFSGLVIELYYYFMISEKRRKIKLLKRAKPSVKHFAIDGLVLSICSYFMIVEKVDPVDEEFKHFILLCVIYTSWLFSAGTTHKFQIIDIAKNKWDAFFLQIKFYLLIISIVLLTIFLIHENSPDWVYFVEAVATYSLISCILAFFLYASKVRNITDEATTIFLRAYELKEFVTPSTRFDNSSKYTLESNQISESTVRRKLQFEYLKEYATIFEFLDRKIDLKSIDTRKTLILRSADPYNITVLQPDSHQMIVNLHVLNDQNKINLYLHSVNEKLVSGGVIVGTFVNLKERYSRFLKDYNYFTANIFYFFDFIWNRVFPKVPIAKKIYSMFSKGKNRAISLAEGLGRLIFCGFEILDITEINNQIYFVAKKVKETNYEKTPYYSPIFKMRRVGEGGKTIFVYKLRTMHPYSEYIQNFVYINNKIVEGGKFQNDFRIPGWGKYFRSVWIDELPMLINFVKRDLKLVGVRPISRQYMSLYSEEHQARRIKFKPGLVPPYYADMPKTVEEIEKSERFYLDAFEKNPIKTDIKYFLKVVKNILFMEKRSA